MTAYRIANWDRLYENSETRKIKRLSWVPTRNKHDGLGFRLMVRDPRKVELFCAWNLILQIASKGEGKERGTLVRDGLPLSPDDLGMMTGYPPGIFKHGLEFFSNPKVAWLEHMHEISGESPEVSGACPAEQNRTEGTEQNTLGADAPRVRRFEKPSADDVTAYGSSIGYALSGKNFVDYYEARGWKYKGGVAMKDWKAAVRTWQSKSGESMNNGKDPLDGAV